MDGLAAIFEFLLSSFPASLHHLRVAQFVINAIAAKHDVVVVIFNLEALDVWSRNDDLRIALILRPLGFDVTKCARYGQSTGENTMWSQEYLFSHLARLTILILHFGHRLCLIDFSSG